MAEKSAQNPVPPSSNDLVYQVYVTVAAILYEKGVQQIVLSPGSRSAPLAITLMRHGGFDCHVLVDERSAAFTALGMAQESQKPVVLVCTSGTAAMNYGSAIAEAFFQQIPLIVLTADRPPEWINQGENQTIFQETIYGQNLKEQFSLPVDFAHSDARKAAYRKVNQALNLSQHTVPGPVHLNAPFREPLYPESPLPKPENPLPLIRQQEAYPRIFHEDLAAAVNNAQNILLLPGMCSHDPYLQFLVESWTQATKAVLVSDVTANLHETDGAITQGDWIFKKALQQNSDQLQPDLLITFGGPLVSKSLKTYLRQFPPKSHWHITPDGHEQNLFHALTQVIPASPKQFFEQSLSWFDTEKGGSQYKQEFEAISGLLDPLRTSENKLSEIGVTQTLLEKLPENAVLQLGNSQPVRHVSQLGLDSRQIAEGIAVYSNRGTSGIDGSVSTAVGHAMNTDKKVVLLVGDLSFMYDRNGLWNPWLPGNLVVVILNNQGGGIFRTMEGPAQQAELESYFASHQSLSFENVAKQHDCTYYLVQTWSELNQAFDAFHQENSKSPVIIEVECG